jgi:ABC-type uncharacterized transport system auxiliary subunit
MKIWTGDYMKTVFLAILTAMIVFQACSEKVLIRRYYVLEFPIDSSAVQNKTSGATCEILTVQVPPAYAQHRIAVRRRSHEISYYQYNYWAVDLAANLTSLLENQFEAEKIFASLASGDLRRIPDYQIAGTVYKLEAQDYEDVFTAHLQMRLDLIEYATGKVALYHQFDKSRILEERDLNLFASEISSIYREEISAFGERISKYLSER